MRLGFEEVVLPVRVRLLTLPAEAVAGVGAERMASIKPAAKAIPRVRFFKTPGPPDSESAFPVLAPAAEA